MALERVLPRDVADLVGQPVERAAQVDRLTREVHPDRARQQDHGRALANSVTSAAIQLGAASTISTATSPTRTATSVARAIDVGGVTRAGTNALKAHPWPDHFADLRAQVKRPHAVLTNGLRLRASALGLKSPTALVQSRDRIGVRLKPLDDDDAPGPDDPADVPTRPGAPTRP